jgi:hypothetical protein
MTEAAWFPPIKLTSAGSICVPSIEHDRRRSVQLHIPKTYSITIFYKLFTGSAQSLGPENIGPERPLPGFLPLGAVLSPSRITLEYNGKIRPQPDRENAFARVNGGDEGPNIIYVKL